MSPAERMPSVIGRSSSRSVFFVRYCLDDAGLRTANEGRRCLRRSPHIAAQNDQERLRCARLIEIEIQHDVSRIVHRPEDAVATHSRLLPDGGKAVECLFPDGEVVDRMFNA